MASEESCLAFDEVLEELRKAFDADKVNIEHVMGLLWRYNSCDTDWQKYYKYDPHKYTRNLVDCGNGKYNIMLLVWPEGSGSSIHDHSGSHCFYKTLAGELCETRFEWPRADAGDEPLKTLCVLHGKKNDVGYISDKIGLHRVENRSHTRPAVSLHIYIPAYDSCKMFDERTSHVNKCKITFYSIDGEIQAPLDR